MGTYNAGMADARLGATVAIGASAGVSIMGFFLARDLSVTVDPLAALPVAVGVFGYLLAVLVFDPLSLPRRSPNARKVISWLSRHANFRMLVIAFTSPAGLAFAVISKSFLALVTGMLVSVVLGVMWWPGPQRFERLLRTIEPFAGERVVEQVRTRNKGRILVYGRSTGTVNP
jgi:hypothetical protein